MTEEEYIKEKLIWVTQGLAMLEKIDQKLQEMKKLAEYARDHEVSDREKEELNNKINKLNKEVQILREKNKDFWLEWQ